MSLPELPRRDKDGREVVNMTATEELVHYAKTLRYEDLPLQTIEAVKLHILDTCGAIAAGSSADGPRNLAGLVREWGGRAESTVLIFGDRVPAPNAAWANSTMSRGFDYETLLTGGATHVSACIVPAAFALAEYSKIIRNRPVTGKELIAAIALGCDLNWRFRVAGGPNTIMNGGWLAETFAPPAIGALGGNLFGFDEEQINYAMAIGYNQCSGTYGATLGEGAGLMAQLSQGMGTKAGVLSVILAERGVAAYKDMIDGRWGLYHMYGNGSYDRDVLVGQLGKRFKHIEPVIKRYPGCGATQTVVNGLLKMIREHDIMVDTISRVTITVSESAFFQCGEHKSEPVNSSEALWNFRYSAAVALLRKDVFVDSFTEEAIHDSQTLALIPRINVRADAPLGRDAVIEIETRDGQSFHIKESDQNPMKGEEIVDKFRRCCRFAAKTLSDEEVEGFIQTLNGLEEVADVGALAVVGYDE
jgi:2-methylcitrate dehydratase PrpD